MKKILIITFIITVVLLSACSLDNGEYAGEPPVQEPSTNQGIIVNNIGFESVNLENLSYGARNAVDKKRAAQGYEVINSGEDMYLVVYAGERRTSGYNMEIQSIVDNEGQTEIKVIETVPQEEAMVLQVITYPLDIVKLESGISGNVTLTFGIAES